MIEALACSLALLLGAPDLSGAERLLAEGRPSEARSAFEAALEGLGGVERARVLDGIGRTRMAEGDVWGAEADFAASLEAAETFAARLHRGQALYFAGRDVAAGPGALAAEVSALMNDAARELERAAEISTGEPAGERALAFLYLGLAEWYRGNPEREEAAYRRALDAESGHPEAALQLGWILERRGRAAEAAAVLGGVPEARRTAAHWSMAGRIAVLAGDGAGAREAFARAVAAAPREVRVYLDLWGVTVREKRFREFEEAVEEVLREDPECWLARYYLGVCRREAGRPREALEALEAAWRLNPGDADSRLLMAEILRSDLRDEAAALPVYLEVLRDRPGLERPRMVVAAMAMKAASAGDCDRARNLLLALREADPGEWAHLLNLAVVERDAGNPEAALRRYEEAEREFPLEPQIPNDRGLLLMGLGRHEEGLAAFRTALERDEDFLDALENLGSYALLAGNAVGSIPYFRRAYERAKMVGGDAAKFRRYLDDALRAGER